jgi:hypothetical protein
MAGALMIGGVFLLARQRLVQVGRVERMRRIWGYRKEGFEDLVVQSAATSACQQRACAFGDRIRPARDDALDKRSIPEPALDRTQPPIGGVKELDTQVAPGPARRAPQSTQGAHLAASPEVVDRARGRQTAQ